MYQSTKNGGENKRRTVNGCFGDGINKSILAADEAVYSDARLGIDMGGTNIKFAVVCGKTPVYKTKIKSPKTIEDIIDVITEKIFKFKKEYNIKFVGVGVPGEVRNGLISTDNLPFDKFPFEKVLSERAGMIVTVDNDANCAALGELAFGSTKDCENIILVTLGTGIGGGIILNRRVCHSNNNMGELGHIIIQAEGGRKCICGQSGCWERYCSATALIKEAKRTASKNKESVLYALMCKNGDMTGEVFFEAIDKGCTVAERVYRRYIKYLARGIESLANIFGPDVIVLAGGITEQGDKILKPLKAELKKDVRIEISSLQSDAGALGAAMM
ncbi:MAG TPA: glucokinase [Clostridiales bacterium]|nr:glucokinase [Clostridiales bacterium]